MKIVVDARTMGCCPSGVGIYLFDFINELSKLNQFEFILATDVAESEQIKSLADKGLIVYCYGKKVFRSIGVFAYFKFLERLLRKEQPVLFWEPNNLFPFYPRGYKGKSVLTIHDLFPITEPKYYSRFYRFYYKNRILRSIKEADILLFNSKETQRQAQEIFPVVATKHNFISYLIVRKPPARLISDDGFFLYIGNLERRKGVDLLLSAYKLYWQNGDRVPLYLGGKIRETVIQEQLEMLQKEGLNIRYLGYLSETDKYDYLSKCSCFFFPSRAEGFGIPPLEAVGYQKPIVVSNLSIFYETIKAPFVSFDLSVQPEKQVYLLCQHMINRDYQKISQEASMKTLECYNGKILGEKLASFFERIVKETHEGCI